MSEPPTNASRDRQARPNAVSTAGMISKQPGSCRRVDDAEPQYPGTGRRQGRASAPVSSLPPSGIIQA